MATDSSATSRLLALFLSQRALLQRRVSHIVDSDAVAEEIVQETFLKLWRKSVDGEAAGLLHRTAMNLAFDHLRAQKVRRRHAEAVGAETVIDHSEEERMMHRSEWESLMQLLAELPERPRRVFLASRLEGDTYASIAARLGVSVSTVEKDMMSVMRLTREWLLRRREDD